MSGALATVGTARDFGERVSRSRERSARVTTAEAGGHVQAPPNRAPPEVG
jgi:hypothetical protein